VLSATTTTPRAEIWAPQTVNILRIQDTRVSGVKRATAVEYCLALPGAYLDSPWGEDHNVVKVGGKIFAFLGGEDGFSITLKNTEDVVDQWRQEYPDHTGKAPYLSKTLWNVIRTTGPRAPAEEEIRDLIDQSYALVVAKLPKSQRPTS
jgi:predicted DNA-binding protein (MmcQ/YjbR family)